MQENFCQQVWEDYKDYSSRLLGLKQEFESLKNQDQSSTTKVRVQAWREFYWKVQGFKEVFKELFNIYLAKEIMRNQFYGPEEIENAFGFSVDKSKIPKIPYSKEELKKAKKLGERLVLRISEDDDGNPMTMEHLSNLAQARMTEDEGKLLGPAPGWDKAKGKLLMDIIWYKDEAEEVFYKKITLRTEWKLVGGNLLKNSTNKIYVEQIKVLRDYLKSVGSLTAEEESECSNENLDKISNDAQKLAGLEINQKHRRSPGEVLYDWFLHFKKFKDGDYLEEKYDWTNIISSGGYLVTIGKIDLAGASVTEALHNFQHESLGVVSVR